MLSEFCRRGVGRWVGSAVDGAGLIVQRIVAVFTATGSINSGREVPLQCRMGPRGGRWWPKRSISATRQPRGKAAAKRRFLELIESRWSAARAAREVGVHERTGRDLRDGIRKTRYTRVHPDGWVVDYRTSSRYIVPVTISDTNTPRAISTRYLSLQDPLAIADGVLNGQTLTRIAAGIGKHKSTVAREVHAHRVDELYLPYQADTAAATARARPKPSKLVVNQDLREAVADGLSRRLSPEQISHRLVKDFPDDESMRVSHETIYQALYFQARGGLKREVQQALRSGRTRRKPHRAPDQRTHRFVDPMIMISDRPAEVDDRAVPGHWEGDLIMSATGSFPEPPSIWRKATRESRRSALSRRMW